VTTRVSRRGALRGQHESIDRLRRAAPLPSRAVSESGNGSSTPPGRSHSRCFVRNYDLLAKLPSWRRRGLDRLSGHDHLASSSKANSSLNYMQVRAGPPRGSRLRNSRHVRTQWAARRTGDISPLGMYATGGGIYSSDGGGTSYVDESYPSDTSGNGISSGPAPAWAVRYTNNSPTSDTLTVYAVCV
jgi:hypothetical protein